MMKTTFFRTLLVAAALFFGACGDTPTDEVSLTILPESVLLGRESGSQKTFQITANGSWAVTAGNDTGWFELDTTSGTTDATVTVTATSENTGAEPRSAKVTVTAGNTSKYITIEQAGTVGTAEAEVYDLQADGSAEAGAVFSLTGTQQGVSYTLLLDGTPTGRELKGTGAAASFEGCFISEGVYTARSVANGEYKQTAMDGSFTVAHTSEPIPVIYYATESQGKINPIIYKTGIKDGADDVKIGEAPSDIQCMEYANGVVYGITRNASTELNDFVTIDLATGALTVIKSSIEADGIALAFNPVDNKMYVITWGHGFGTIDLATGDYTSIAMLPSHFAIAIDSEGNCYAQAFNVPLGTARFGMLNLVSGAFTPIIQRSGMIEYIQNIELDKMTGKLYWMKRVAVTEASATAFQEIDKLSGEATQIENIRRKVESFTIVTNVEYEVTENS